MDKINRQLNSGRFDNSINVIDATGKHLTPSYFHRAKGLVKNGRAKWVDDKTIQIISAVTQAITQTFPEYLTGKGMKPPYIQKSMALADKFHAMLCNDSPSTEVIAEFINDVKRNGVKGDSTGWGENATKTAYQFLDKYAEFCGEASLFAAAYRKHICETFEEPARNAVNGYKKAMVFIPEDTEIDPYFLDGLSNDEFVTAFKALQQLVYDIYEEIERTSPFDWGWQGWQDIAAYGVWHNRIWGLLGVLAEIGHLDGNILVVDKKKLNDHDIAKQQNQLNSKAKANMIIAGFMDMGLLIEGFDDKKAETFMVSCPDTPNLITVLNAYFKERRRECCKCRKADVYPCMKDCYVTFVGHHKQIFSYRFVEQHPPNTHDTEVLFMAVTDSAPEALRKIQYYLHDEATKHGYKIPPWTPAHGGSIQYWNYTDNWGSKMWLTVSSGTSWMDFFYMLSMNKWTLKTKFKRILKKYPDKADWLDSTYPGMFNRSDGTLIMQNPTFEDVEIILEFYKLENNIKPL